MVKEVWVPTIAKARPRPMANVLGTCIFPAPALKLNMSATELFFSKPAVCASVCFVVKEGKGEEEMRWGEIPFDSEGIAKSVHPLGIP